MREVINKGRGMRRTQQGLPDYSIMSVEEENELLMEVESKLKTSSIK